ncbi:hypothetical protein L7F22_054468 [Adiantum nelumboides]|nr:hypothetical protein [Adiantum nelumboides]
MGHKFNEETLKQLKSGKDGFLTNEEIKCFQEKHGKAFAFELAIAIGRSEADLALLPDVGSLALQGKAFTLDVASRMAEQLSCNSRFEWRVTELAWRSKTFPDSQVKIGQFQKEGGAAGRKPGRHFPGEERDTLLRAISKSSTTPFSFKILCDR